ncbi:hypothetical protein AB6876_00470 [Carnobacterium maltaromaticum]|uniref:hypothetical protein n=1 Tax=Carnobacterium maltaromaticum TaxID=2751 RepID=UPI0039BE518F
MKSFLFFTFILFVIIIIYFVLKKSKLKNMNCNNDEQQNISISPSLTVEDDKPFEIPITLNLISERTLDERKLYEIKDSNVIAKI